MRLAPGPLALLLALVMAGTVLGVSSCASRRLRDGVFHGRGFQVVPPSGWEPAADGKAALTLQHPARPGAMLVNPTCAKPERSRSPELLMRHLLFGLTEPRIGTLAAVTVDGLPAGRTTFEGATEAGRVRGEAVVVRGRDCLYDFLYVAPPDAFDAGLGDFRAFVDSLRSPAP